MNVVGLHAVFNDGSDIYFMDSISSRLMFKAAAMFSAGIPEAINVFIISALPSALPMALPSALPSARPCSSPLA